MLRLFRWQEHAAGFVTSAALGIGFFSLLMLGLGLCGALNRVTALVVICGGVAAGIAWILKTKVPVKTKVPDTFLSCFGQRVDWTAWLT